MVRKADLPKHVIKTAFDLAARQGWRRVSMADIAAEAKVPLVDLYRLYRSKEAIVSGFSRLVDEEVLATAFDHSPDDSARDRLFDVLMRRFEILSAYKDGLAVVLCETACSPGAAVFAGCRLLRSMAWMLEAAGIGSAGLIGRLRTKALAALYLSTLAVWLRDDTPDMARTMAVLDRRLARAEDLTAPLRGRTRRPPEERAPAAG